MYAQEVIHWHVQSVGSLQMRRKSIFHFLTTRITYILLSFSLFTANCYFGLDWIEKVVFCWCSSSSDTKCGSLSLLHRIKPTAIFYHGFLKFLNSTRARYECIWSLLFQGYRLKYIQYTIFILFLTNSRLESILEKDYWINLQIPLSFICL